MEDPGGERFSDVATEASNTFVSGAYGDPSGMGAGMSMPGAPGGMGQMYGRPPPSSMAGGASALGGGGQGYVDADDLATEDGETFFEEQEKKKKKKKKSKNKSRSESDAEDEEEYDDEYGEEE